MGSERDRVLKHYNSRNSKEISKETALKYLKDNLGIDFDETLKKLEKLDTEIYKELKSVVAKYSWEGVEAKEAKPALEEFHITPIKDKFIVIRVFSSCLIYDKSKSNIFLNKISGGCSKALSDIVKASGLGHISYPTRQISTDRYVLGVLYFDIIGKK